MKHVTAKCVPVLLGLVFVLVLSGHHDQALAQLPDSGCSLATLSGGYVWQEAYQIPTEQGIFPGVSAGREIHDGAGNITSGLISTNTPQGAVPPTAYTGTVTVEANCTGTYSITLAGGTPGGGGTIYIDPGSGNFTLLDESLIGIAHFRRDGM